MKTTARQHFVPSRLCQRLEIRHGYTLGWRGGGTGSLSYHAAGSPDPCVPHSPTRNVHWGAHAVFAGAGLSFSSLEANLK